VQTYEDSLISRKRGACRKSANITRASGREGEGRARRRGREVRTIDGVEGVGRFLLNYHLGVHCRYRKFFNLNKKDANVIVNHAINILDNTKKLDGAQKFPKNFTQARQKDKPCAKKQALTSDSVSE
jgi:hypothetical protein